MLFLVLQSEQNVYQWRIDYVCNTEQESGNHVENLAHHFAFVNKILLGKSHASSYPALFLFLFFF